MSDQLPASHPWRFARGFEFIGSITWTDDQGQPLVPSATLVARVIRHGVTVMDWAVSSVGNKTTMVLSAGQTESIESGDRWSLMDPDTQRLLIDGPLHLREEGTAGVPEDQGDSDPSTLTVSVGEATATIVVSSSIPALKHAAMHHLTGTDPLSLDVTQIEGLGSAATTDVGEFDAAGTAANAYTQAAALVADLSGVTDPAAARDAIDLGNAAVKDTAVPNGVATLDGTGLIPDGQHGPTVARVDTVPPAYQLYTTTLVVTNGQLQTLAAESGYVWGLVDQAGRIAIGVKIDGSVVGKITQADGSITLAKLDANTQAGVMRSLSVEQSNDAFALVDAAGKIALRVSAAGLVTGNFGFTDGSIPRVKLGSDVSLPLPVPAESGYSFALVDAAGKIAFGVTPDGVLHGSFAADPALSTTTPTGTSTVLVDIVTVAGLGQVRATDLTTGVVTILTAGSGKRHVDPIIVGSDVLFRRETSPGVWEPYWCPLAGGVAAPVFPSSTVTGWGDSMTAGAGGGGTTYLTTLASLTGLTTVNRGIGGETSIAIAARQGGAPTLLTITGNQIPASGPVTVTANTAAIPTAQGSQSFTGTLVGVPGTLATSAGVTTFTRTTAGSAVSCPAASPFITDLGLDARDDTVIIWSGRNNNGSRAQVNADIAAMVGYLNTLGKRYLVLSVCNGVGETTGTSAHTNIVVNLNADLAATYGTRFVDVRSYLVTNGLADAGITPTTQDTIDVAGDTIPASLRVDSVHLTAAGYTIVGTQVRNRMQQKGWV